MPDYSKGKIYTIRCFNDDTKIYVGSTTQTLSKRFGDHKSHSKDKSRSRMILYNVIDENWGLKGGYNVGVSYFIKIFIFLFF